MLAPPLAIVAAFVDPVVELMRSCLGLDARPVALALLGELDPPPAISVTVEATGALRGGITWAFSEELVRDVATRMLSVDPCAVDAETCRAAAAELANIAVGNATAALLDAGYDIEIHPPTVHTAAADRRLARRALAVTLHTGRGDVRVFLSIQEVPRGNQ